MELGIERPVAGGRMLARHDGQVVLVRGAIPGERVRARIERRHKQVLFAETVDVLEASPDRRTPGCDLACGGSSYAHILYDRQRALKAEILRDAFARIAKLPLVPPDVMASPEHGYRMRARLHVTLGRVGFYREGTHTICDAGATGQLRPDTLAAVEALVAAHPDRMIGASGITVSENVPATQRVFHVEMTADEDDDDGLIPPSTGFVEDSTETIWASDPPIPGGTRWRRRASSFFQGNRFLLGALIEAVLACADGADENADLYAGGGLFSVALAALGGRVTAVESSASSAADLVDNAEPYGDLITPLAIAVEDAVRRRPKRRPDVVILDPPRVGASTEALAGLLKWQAPKIVYVSCDPPTLARDAAKLVAGGYRLESMAAFDLFPNTPHLEVVATFTAA
jgi:tRNA/tmRNA/rRNA uracil-C5-methylase (TrmA/RlmC/RlmD family)